MACEMISSEINWEIVCELFKYLFMFELLSLHIDIDFYLNFSVAFFWFNVLEVIKNMVSWFTLNNWRAFIDLS